MKDLLQHQTQRKGLFKFLLLLAILTGYFLYLSWTYDLATGGIVSALTWSFFVLCTPVADAGFLIDFPVRLITGFKMVMTEIVVWGIAITLNIATISLAPDAYQTTFLTSLFYKILTTPWPYWSIIFLCAAGTFLSIRFGDEMLDVIAHKDYTFYRKHNFKYKIIAIIALFLVIFWSYYHLIETLKLKLP